METIPKPASPLGVHQILSAKAGVRVSPLCLVKKAVGRLLDVALWMADDNTFYASGAMNFGDAWKVFMGECGKDNSFAMMDYFYEMGGNFIDTANVYQNEESEQWIGEWMEKKGNRDSLVIATKYTMNWRAARTKGQIQSNFLGNSAKSMHVSIEDSLKKLRTDYIDIFYVHWWDYTTSVEEVMHGLNRLVLSGKVLYLGISDTPAWIVSKANQYARDHGLAQFVVYQGRWSAAQRDFERDIMPMCVAEGMAMACWNVLGGGHFKTEEQRANLQKEGRNMGAPSENDIKISNALEAVAKRKGTELTSIALSYVRHKAPYTYPIIGGRKVSHLKSNIAALEISLSDAEIDEIDNAIPFDIGFPLAFMFQEPEFLLGDKQQKYSARLNASDMPLMKTGGTLQVHDRIPRPLVPTKIEE